jgi:Putative beta-lactamase-inhibitor-like, PepSY-like
MKISGLAFIVALAASALPLRVQAVEKRIKEGDVPKPVIEAVQKKYPKAKMTEFEQDVAENVFEIRVETADETVTVSISPDGKIREEETRIKADALPADVKKGLAGSKYGKGTVKRVERVIRDEQADEPLYEVVVALNGSKTEVVMDKSGAITKEAPRGKSKEH